MGREGLRIGWVRGMLGRVKRGRRSSWSTGHLCDDNNNGIANTKRKTTTTATTTTKLNFRKLNWWFWMVKSFFAYLIAFCVSMIFYLK